MISAFEFRVLFVSIVFMQGTLCMSHVYANDEMWARLAEGGKVVLMRHAPVMKGSDSGNSLLRDPSCNNERNLSDQGRHGARVIGERFRERNTPISEVQHSPFCRTSDTARIAFGSGLPVQHLLLLEIQDVEQAAGQTAQLSHIIGSYAGEGNLILITHDSNIRAVSFELLKHLDFLVLQPTGGDEFEELGVVRFAETN